MQWVEVDRTGFSFAVWKKWKRTRRKVGTLTVSVGGLRWRPASGKASRRLTWDDVAEWLSS
jgi:hypothetical protein